MTVRAQATFCCARWKAHIFSILNSTLQRNTNVSLRSRRLSINCFLHVQLFTFWPQAVLQTNGVQRINGCWRLRLASWLTVSSRNKPHLCKTHDVHNAVPRTVLTLPLLEKAQIAHSVSNTTKRCFLGNPRDALVVCILRNPKVHFRVHSSPPL